jgi:acyl-CoA synthetase (NDP forming)
VNPRYDEIMGVKSYPSVTNLPEAPDVVGIVVPWDQVLDVLEESHRKGAGSAIVISAGFAERGIDERRDLQRELGAFASTSGMRISGPNCLGLANVKHDIWAAASSRERSKPARRSCRLLRVIDAFGLDGGHALWCPLADDLRGPAAGRAGPERLIDPRDRR